MDALSMHLKSYQIDRRLVRTGAANFSASGLKRQDNDLVVIESTGAATAFKRAFDLCSPPLRETIVIISRIKAFWSWLADARYALLSVAVVVIALGISLRPHTTEPTVRLTGLVLQLLGIATIIWGISETRALFGLPSLTSKAKAWLGRFPLFRRNVAIAVGSIEASTDFGKMRVYGTHSPGATPTIETRLDALEKNVTTIHERINTTLKEMDEEFHMTADALKREEQSRIADDTAIQEKLEATGTGGVHISAIGALLLFVGVILSTASVEIAGLFNSRPHSFHEDRREAPL